MYRAAIIGCGGIAQVHAAVLSSLPDVTITACADIRPERAQAMAEKYGCHAYSSIDDLLQNEEVDTVHLCTPHVFHAPMALQAAKKGIAVFTEKPPVMTREQWPMLEEAAKLVPLGICFQNRYNAGTKEAKRIIEEKIYGSPKGARAFVTWSRGVSYYKDSGWRGTWEKEGGGVLINQSIHTLDLLIWLLGQPESAEAHMANHHLRDVIEVEDTIEAYLKIGGCPVLFYATTAYSDDSPVFLEIQLEEATIRVESDAVEVRTKEGIERRTYQAPETLGKNYWGSGHTSCIADFYDSLKNNRPFQNDLESVRATADTMLRLYEDGKKTL